MVLVLRAGWSGRGWWREDHWGDERSVLTQRGSGLPYKDIGVKSVWKRGKSGRSEPLTEARVESLHELHLAGVGQAKRRGK